MHTQYVLRIIIQTYQICLYKICSNMTEGAENHQILYIGILYIVVQV